MVRCAYCPARGIIRRPKTGCAACKECFFRVFEDEIHETIVNGNLFRAGDRVALAASGGKGMLKIPKANNFSHSIV